jgi:hypothetical protein
MIWSAVALDEASMPSNGNPAFLVAPSVYRRLDAPARCSGEVLREMTKGLL